MNYVVPGAYPGGGGGGGGPGTGVNSVAGADGILITGTASDVIVTNSGVVSLLGTGVATVTNDGVGNYNINVTGAITTVNGASGAVTLTAVAPLAIQTNNTQNILSIDFIPQSSGFGSPSYTFTSPNLFIDVNSVSQFTGTCICSYNIGVSSSGWSPGGNSYILWTGGTTGTSYVRETIPVNSGAPTIYHSGSFIFDAGGTPTTLEVQFTIFNINLVTPGVFPGIVPNSTLNVVQLTP